MKHKEDKYGCIDENCKEHYPVIPRKSIMAEMDAGEAMNNDETKHYIKEVLIEEFYSRENGEVFWNWRFQNGTWNKELTAFKEVPYYKVNLI